MHTCGATLSSILIWSHCPVLVWQVLVSTPALPGTTGGWGLYFLDKLGVLAACEDVWPWVGWGAVFFFLASFWWLSLRYADQSGPSAPAVADKPKRWHAKWGSSSLSCKWGVLTGPWISEAPTCGKESTPTVYQRGVMRLTQPHHKSLWNNRQACVMRLTRPHHKSWWEKHRGFVMRLGQPHLNNRRAFVWRGWPNLITNPCQNKSRHLWWGWANFIANPFGTRIRPFGKLSSYFFLVRIHPQSVIVR